MSGAGDSYAINLTSVTDSAGTYVLTLVAANSGIEDASGNLLAANASDTWVFTEQPTPLHQLSADNKDNKSVSFGEDCNRKVLAVGDPDADQVKMYRANSSGQLQHEQTIPGGSSDNFGYSVSMSADGKTVAIGAHLDSNSGGANSGLVQIYRHNGTSSPNPWEQKGSINSIYANDESGTSVSLSEDGNVLAIGAPDPFGKGGNGDAPGHVQIYLRNGNGTWPSTATQDIDGIDGVEFAGSGGEFGSSVSMSADGSTIAIGAPKYDWEGQVSIYHRSGNGPWSLQRRYEGDADQGLGESVSLSEDGNVLAIGAPGSPWTDSHVRIYRRSNGTWPSSPEKTITGTAGDLLGRSVSLNSAGDVLAIGEPSSGAGQITIYRHNGSWVLEGTISGEASTDDFGESVSVSPDGTAVAIGAPGGNYVTISPVPLSASASSSSLELIASLGPVETLNNSASFTFTTADEPANEPDEPEQNLLVNQALQELTYQPAAAPPEQDLSTSALDDPPADQDIAASILEQVFEEVGNEL